MAKGLKDYLVSYLEVLDASGSDVAIPPRVWIFQMWQRDTGVTNMDPEGAYALLEAMKEDDPSLHIVVRSQIDEHVESVREQARLKNEGAPIDDIIRAGVNHAVIPKADAYSQARRLGAACF